MPEPPHNDTDPISATDPSLVRRLGDMGDQASWQLFHDTYAPVLHNFTRRAGLNEADARDVVQETIIDVSRHMPGFQYDRSKGSFKSWLLVCVRNRINMHFRKKHYHNQGEKLPREQRLDTALAATQPGNDPELERAWTEEWERHRMEAALVRVRARAKPEQFQIFQLHVLNDQSVAEVAQRLKVNAAKVYWAKYQVSALLKAALREIDEG